MTINFFQVGGCVRDEILNLKSKDIDFAVECSSFDAMRDAIKARGGEIFLETPKFFTIRAHVPGMGAADFVLCRKDSGYSDGRRPDFVEVGTILDDLRRRDFTMNAIAKREDGSLLDPFGGADDIRDGVIRCVGSPWERFSEDSLRMLRALRFSITKNFNLHGDVSKAMKNDDMVALLHNISAERIREELFKCFAFDTLKTLNLLNEFESIRNMVLDRNRFNIWLRPTREN